MKRSITTFQGNLYLHLETTEEEQKAQERVSLDVGQDALSNVKLAPPQRTNTLLLDASDGNGENNNDDDNEDEENDNSVNGGGDEGEEEEDEDEVVDETTRSAIKLLDDNWVLEFKNFDGDTRVPAIRKVSAAKNICDLSFRTLS